MALTALHSVIEKLALAPGIRQIRKRAHNRLFQHNIRRNLFSGIYDSFEAAATAAPNHQPHHYNHDAAASLYADMMSRIFDYDYPAMFWLQQSFAEGLRHVFDLGGHVGIKYYAFKPKLRPGNNIHWTVGDLPAIVDRGRALAQQKGVDDQLRFADALVEMSGCDVLFASGSLQYLPMTLAELLADLTQRPRRIIVNITPIHDEAAYFTVNSIGVAYCPYRIQRRATFIKEVQDCGYVLRDHWRTPGKGMELPFNSSRSLNAYSGFCFDLAYQPPSPT